MSVTIRVLDGMVYRKGSSTDLSMTPRPEEDVTSDLKEAGLSTWRELATAIPIGEKGQKIDLAKLDPALLGCFQDEDGHVSIVPIDRAHRSGWQLGYDKADGMGGEQRPGDAARVHDDGRQGDRRVQPPEANMNENRFTDAEWQRLDDDIQKRLRALANEIQSAEPAARPRFSKTVTENLPLFSYVSFRRQHVAEREYTIVGVAMIPQDGQWRIDADVSDEEEGTIFFELPRTPFSVASFAEMRLRALAATDELIAGGKPVLLRLFGSASPVLPGQPANLLDVARKA